MFLEVHCISFMNAPCICSISLSLYLNPTHTNTDTDETPTAGNESSGDTTANSAAVKRRSSIKDRIALLDKNSNESVRVAEHPATPPPPPPAHTKPKAFAYLCRDNADTSGVYSSTNY